MGQLRRLRLPLDMSFVVRREWERPPPPCAGVPGYARGRVQCPPSPERQEISPDPAESVPHNAWNKNGKPRLCARLSRQPWLDPPTSRKPGLSLRSEERRVGKECSSRWSPDS